MRCASTLAVMVMALLVAGCSGGSSGVSLGSVSGTVTINGNPASDVMVAFTPVDGGRGSSGTTDANGNYTLIFTSTEMGAQVGKHKVQISDSSLPSDDNLNLRKPASKVPAEIGSIFKEVEVTSGSNTIDLQYP